MSSSPSPDFAFSGTPCALPRSLDLGQAQALRDLLGTCLSAGGDLVLDGGEVERAGAASAQLLLAALRTARTAGRRAAFSAVSDELRAAIADLGLAPAMAEAMGAPWPVTA